jgi:hypothetical protein
MTDFHGVSSLKNEPQPPMSVTRIVSSIEQGDPSWFMADDGETVDSVTMTEGASIGTYRLRERLGDGGTWVVWAIEQSESNIGTHIRKGES